MSEPGEPSKTAQRSNPSSRPTSSRPSSFRPSSQAKSRPSSDGSRSPGSPRSGDDASEHSLQFYTALQQGVTEFVVDQNMGTQFPQQVDSEVDFYPGVERAVYDYAAERRNPYPAKLRASMAEQSLNQLLDACGLKCYWIIFGAYCSLVYSTAHLIKGSLGSGILAIHEAYMHGGLWTSLVVTLFLGTIATHNMLILVRSAQRLYVKLRVPRLSYPDLVEAAVAIGPMKCFRKYSKGCRYMVDIILFSEIFGCCCIYQIMIASTAKYVLEKVIPSCSDWQLHVRMYVVMITLPMMLLTMIRSLKLMVPLALAADFFIVLCIAATLYYSIAAAGSLSERYAWKSIKGLFQVTGTCLFGIDGITFAMPIENHMSKPWYFPIVANIAMPVVIAAIAVVGFFGYLGWGESCHLPITTHMPLDVGTIIMQIVLVVVLLITFAVRFYVPFRIIYRYAGKRFKVCKQRGYYERILRLALATVMTCVSVAFPNIDQVISFLGNFFLAPITFIFPALIETFVFWKDRRRRHGHKWVHISNVLNVILGLTLCAGGLFNLITGTPTHTAH